MYREVAPFCVKQGRFGSGERFPRVVDGAGIVAFHPTIYAVHVLRAREGSAGTMEAHLRAIALLMNWAVARGIDLRTRFETLELISPSEIIDLRDILRLRVNRERSDETRARPAAISAGSFYNRCRLTAEFILWHARNVLMRMRLGDSRLPEGRRRIEQFERLMLENLPRGRSVGREGIDEAAQALFLQAIKLGNPLNPFQQQHQLRNEALLLLYYETGMRRAEALKLKGEHLIALGSSSPQVRVIRDPDDPQDTRQIEPRIKTLPRDIPISIELAQLLLRWMEVRRDRSRYGEARKTPYVFVARTGRPLGLRTVNDMFDLLRKRIGGLPKELMPHVLRNTANDRFSAAADVQGLSEEHEKQARNYTMGWTKDSQQGDKYTQRHTRRRAEKVMLDMQDKSSVGKSR